MLAAAPAGVRFLLARERSPARYTPAEAEAYTRWLATHHYENFQVVSFLLPKRLHQDFYNVYAYCRWADDLGDEMGSPAESLRLLAWWREQLEAMYAGEATHPVFVALGGTVARHAIPQAAVRGSDSRLRAGSDASRATRPGRTCTTIAAIPPILSAVWCSTSAAIPMPRRQRLSDATCTALQLANFWQDVAVDLEKDRVYIPLEVLARHGYTVEDLFARRVTQAFREVMREIVARARELFVEGLPLSAMVDRRLALDLDLFSRGGMRVLDKIAEQDYDVLSRRPAISKAERVWLLLGSLRAGRCRGRRDDAGGFLRPLPPRGSHARSKFLLFVCTALARATQRHVRRVRVHALLRRFERRTRRESGGHRAVAHGARRSAGGPLRALIRCCPRSTIR